MNGRRSRVGEIGYACKIAADYVERSSIGKAVVTSQCASNIECPRGVIENHAVGLIHGVDAAIVGDSPVDDAGSRVGVNFLQRC